MSKWTTYRTSALSIPIPNARVATTTGTRPLCHSLCLCRVLNKLAEREGRQRKKNQKIKKRSARGRATAHCGGARREIELRTSCRSLLFMPPWYATAVAPDLVSAAATVSTDSRVDCVVNRQKRQSKRTCGSVCEPDTRGRKGCRYVCGTKRGMLTA